MSKNFTDYEFLTSQIDSSQTYFVTSVTLTLSFGILLKKLCRVLRSQSVTFVTVVITQVSI